MAFALWNPNLETGNTQIDAQHKNLFALVNELHDAIVGGKGNDILDKVLDKMIKYTATHFQDEEAFWRSKNYPYLAEHLQQHKTLAGQALDIQKKFKSGQMTLTLNLSQFLKDWLNHHIRGEDKRAIEYLRDHNML